MDWLERRLGSTQCFLEYGSGGSTRLAAALNVPRIISVESDRAYISAVRQALIGGETSSVINLLFADVGATKEWGFPKTAKGLVRWPTYSLGAWDFVRANGLSPDLILIDGRFRVACLLISLLEARPGTTILFDDFALRRETYGCVEEILAPAEMIEKSAVFVVPDAVPQLETARLLARHVCNPQ